MKWSVVAILTLALFVYGLLLAIHASREPASGPVSGAGPSGPISSVASSDSGFHSVAATEDSSGAAGSGGTAPFPVVVESSRQPWADGCRLYEEGRFDEALESLRNAVRQAPERAGRHELLGRCALRTGDPQLAVDELERAVELDPTRRRAWSGLGRAYLALKDLEAAREAVDMALEIDLGFADAWEVLGLLETDAGKLEAATAAFSRAVQLDPRFAWAWNNLGYVQILRGRFAEAVRPLSEAAGLRPAEAVFQNNLGVALERTGELVEAERAYARAAEAGHPTAPASAQRVEERILAHGGPAHRDSLAAVLPHPTQVAVSDSTRW